MNNEPETGIKRGSHIILAVPRDTVRLKVEAAVLDENGQMRSYEAVLGPEDIRQSRQDFLDNVDGGDDYDAVYTLTDKGRELLNRP